MGGDVPLFLPQPSYRNSGADDIVSVSTMDTTTSVSSSVNSLTSPRPSIVYIVLHDRQQTKQRHTKDTEVVSVHYDYGTAAFGASQYVCDYWEMDDEDEEWLQEIDWQGDGWFDDEQEGINKENSLSHFHRVHILVMQIH
jgi:hypothetical protein